MHTSPKHFYAHEPAGLRKEKLIAAILAREQERCGKHALTIVDVGCGNGHLSAFMGSLGNRVLGLDQDAAAVAAAHERYGGEAVRFKVGSLANHPGEFDVITAFEVCEHIPDVAGFLQTVRASLAPGGLFLISVPNGWSLEETARRFVQHTSTGARLKKWLRSSGALPKSNAQSAADSPHVHFWGQGGWARVFTAAGFSLESIANVSLFFKQLYYLGGRRLIKPGSLLFKLLNSLDSMLVRLAPKSLADGWVMAWRKK